MEGEPPERHEEEGASHANSSSSSSLPSSSASVATESSSSSAAADLSSPPTPSSSFFSAQPNNSVEAEEALESGLRASRQGDASSLEKAERLLAKSVRLNRTTEACQALERVRRQRAELRGSNQQQQTPSQRASNSSRREGEPMRPSPSSSFNSRPAAAAPADSQPGSAAYSHPPPPPRPFPPGSAAAAAAAAAAQPPAWRTHTLTAPAFLTARFPSLAGRRWTYQYPGFFYIPPSQRRPIAFVWGIVFVLCLFRLLGLMSGGRGYYDPLDLDSSTRGSGSRRRHRHQQREQYEDVEERTDGRWSSTAYSTTYRGDNFMMSINNLFTLLPFLFFFIGPLLRSLFQEHQARRNYQAQQQQQQQQQASHPHNQ